MKRLRKLVVVLLSLSLTSCGFVNYVEASSYVEQSVVDEITTKRNEYIQKFDETYLEENYESTEKAQLRKCLIEAKAELHECSSLTELEETFKKNEDVINAIKTKSDYAAELATKKKEYISKIDDISNESLYREKEKETFLFYIEKAKEAINGLGSIKEDFDKVFNAYKNIIEAIKTDAEYDKEEAEAFEKYKLDAIDEISNYLNLDDYREAESNSIKGLLDLAVNNIKEAKEYVDIDAFVRKYKTDVYQYETDTELYSKELLSLIDESKSEVSSYVNTINYRDNEIAIINSLLEAFNKDVGGIKIKEEVTKLVDTYKGLLDAIKTDAQLYEEEKQILIDNLFQELKTVVDYENLSDEDRNYYDNFYETLLLLSTKEEVESVVGEEKIKGYKKRAINGDNEALIQYQLYLVDSLNYYLDKSLYREAQQEEIDSIINASYGPILSCTNYNDTINALNARKADLDNVLTNDEMWEKEDLEFFETLHNLYGDDILIPEGSLTEANDYYELAKIVDYYGFYQLDKDTFVRDSFRVNVTFQYGRIDDLLDNLINNYCELVKYAVGLNARQEKEFIVFELVPYSFGSVHHTNDDGYEVLECFVEYCDYGSDALRTTRPQDYNDFYYYGFEKNVKVWNSQQLWYALEHEYIPICESGSNAEYVLNRAKIILNTIIKNGMSDKEKIFSIFTWVSKNVQYAYNHEGRPKGLVYYPEGALEDGFAVCSGFAKLYLIMLRIEGIEAFITFQYASSHESVLIKIDNKYYLSDVTFGTYWSNYLRYSYMLCLNILDCYLYSNMNFAVDCSDIYEHLCFNDKGVFISSQSEFDLLLQDFLYMNNRQKSLNILYKDLIIDFTNVPSNVWISKSSHYFGANNGIEELVIVLL